MSEGKGFFDTCLRGRATAQNTESTAMTEGELQCSACWIDFVSRLCADVSSSKSLDAEPQLLYESGRKPATGSHSEP